MLRKHVIAITVVAAFGVGTVAATVTASAGSAEINIRRDKLKAKKGGETRLPAVQTPGKRRVPAHSGAVIRWGSKRKDPGGGSTQGSSSGP
jgi:hypothetical protein